MREYDGEDHWSDWAERIKASQPDASASLRKDFTKLEALGIDISKLSSEVLAIVKWNLEHPKGVAKTIETTPASPESNAYTVVWPYSKWRTKFCACCGKRGCTGLYRCTFKGSVEALMLCGACGLRDAYAKWNGFYSRKLIDLWLIATLTYGDKQDASRD